MIRDPSDGSIKPDVNPADLTGVAALNVPVSNSLLSTSTSGLPITKAKADYLARLEESRKWLKNYVRPTINQ